MGFDDKQGETNKKARVISKKVVGLRQKGIDEYLFVKNYYYNAYN